MGLKNNVSFKCAAAKHLETHLPPVTMIENFTQVRAQLSKKKKRFTRASKEEFHFEIPSLKINMLNIFCTSKLSHKKKKT